MGYTNLLSVKEDLDITDNKKDSILNRDIVAASAMIDNYLNYSFVVKNYTETFDIRDIPNNKIIYLQNRPVNSITSVTYNGVTLNPATDYLDYKNFGYIKILTTTFNYSNNASIEGDQILTVIYNAGKSPVPADIEYICRSLVVDLFTERAKSNNIASESIGSWSRSYLKNEEGWNPLLKTLLNKYIDVPV